MSTETNDSASNTQCRILMQQCVHAELRVDETNVLTIDRGVLIYVSFFKRATEDFARKAAQFALQLKLCETESGRHVSILELPADVLLIPQACLGGKKKGNSMQYHQLIDKTRGRELFDVMKSELEKLVSLSKPQHSADGAARPRVLSGIYGQRQKLKIDASLGPSSHVIDL
ncbi:D-aminoacyl-tRNA deacylase 2 [Galendromus occidentalis]|uniref:D-aminoacyl-tRNA deacylase n=1 Tax=Galendromus occidentalis TaxID=34638 RepID=A0AAJ6QPT2_9ACAR|nr:D-aminoacyl-tRNA deacylase 2 [Galendromus occidentalis]